MTPRNKIQNFAPDIPLLEAIDDRIGKLLGSDKLSSLERSRLIKLRNDLRYADRVMAPKVVNPVDQKWMSLPDDVACRPLLFEQISWITCIVPGSETEDGKCIAYNWLGKALGWVYRVRDYVEKMEQRLSRPADDDAERLDHPADNI